MATIAKVKDEAPTPEALADGGLEALLGYHLRLANVALYRDFTAKLQQLDVTQRQGAMLALIAANPGVSQVAIAARLGSDRATIMSMVDRLEVRGLITRERSKSDRRRQELYLTPKGEALRREVRILVDQHEARFTALFNKDEIEFLFNALRRIHDFV